MRAPREETVQLIEMMEEGSLDPMRMARDLLGFLSTYEVRDFIRANDIQGFDNDEEE